MSTRVFFPPGPMMAGSLRAPPPPPERPTQLPLPEDAPLVVEVAPEEIDLSALIGAEGRRQKPYISPPDVEGTGLW